MTTQEKLLIALDYGSSDHQVLLLTSGSMSYVLC